MTTQVQVVDFIAGDVTAINAWLANHPDITVIYIDFQSPFSYIVYFE